MPEDGTAKPKAAVALACFVVTVFGLLSCSGRNPTAIQHTVFILKENHTFDNYFGAFPGANGVSSGFTSNGRLVPLTAMPDRYRADLCNSWDCAIQAIDGGKMNGFDLISGKSLAAYTQASEQEIPNYWAYARTFVLADGYFTSVHGPSFPNYLFTIAAQSGGVIDNGSGSSGGVACDGTPSGTVTVIDSSGLRRQVSPCFDFLTLPELLESAGISWKYYFDDFTVLSTIRHIRNSRMWKENLGTTTQFLADARIGHLPAVSWLVEPFEESEHPPQSICAGQNQTTEFLNAIMEGPDWYSAVVFITYDDFGGFYDHVPPPELDEFGLGQRVPLLIISPFAKAGYISHTIYEHSSILKFIETRYGLRSLTTRDAGASNMLDNFDFNQPRRPPLILPSGTCP
jgi:phospholipase C